jgi:hypothetical protein
MTNEILLVFPEPRGHTLSIGDRLRFNDLRLEAPVKVENVTRGGAFSIHIPAQDAHDLRLPIAHGGSRSPSAARLIGP